MGSAHSSQMHTVPLKKHIPDHKTSLSTFKITEMLKF